MIINKRKRICHLVDFAVSHKMKLKESKKKIHKYLDVVRELKKQSNMKVTVIPVVVGALGTVPDILERMSGERENRGRIEIILTIALLRSA